MYIFYLFALNIIVFTISQQMDIIIKSNHNITLYYIIFQTVTF